MKCVPNFFTRVCLALACMSYNAGGRENSCDTKGCDASSPSIEFTRELHRDIPDFKLSKEHCSMKYGTRKFLNEEHKHLPPVLYSFPGSGNTWTRLLIDYATGIYSGSAWNDGALVDDLPGEMSCNLFVSVIKAHPSWSHPARALFPPSKSFYSDKRKCEKGSVTHFKRAILLLRDPFDAIWSEFERQRSGGSHVVGISRHTFNWRVWEASAMQLAEDYYTMWAREYQYIKETLPTQQTLFVTYEDLKDKSTQISTLHRIVAFINTTDFRVLSTEISEELPAASLHQLDSLEQGQLFVYDNERQQQSPAPLNERYHERLQCSFELAESDRAHRSTDAAATVTKAEAYSSAALVCGMWQLFGAHALQHGYLPWEQRGTLPSSHTSRARGLDSKKGMLQTQRDMDSSTMGKSQYCYNFTCTGRTLLTKLAHASAAPLQVNPALSFAPIADQSSIITASSSDDEASSLGQAFPLGSAGASKMVGWRYYDDGDTISKYGWILDINKEQVASICASVNSTLMCPELTHRTTLSFQVHFSEHPVLEITYLLSNDPRMGIVKVWLDGNGHCSQDNCNSGVTAGAATALKSPRIKLASRYGDLEPLPRTATIVPHDRILEGRSSAINKDLYVMPSLKEGVQTVHISMVQMKPEADEYRFKLLGVSSC